MPIETKQKHSRDHEARADLIRNTVSAYADDAVAFTRDVSRAQAEMGNAHLEGSKECNCGLCGAVAKADLSEVLASAHLIAEQACGCARCMALAALADEAQCPGPGTPRFDPEELRKKAEGDDAGPSADPGAQPGAAPGAAPAAQAGLAPAGHARLEGGAAESRGAEHGAAAGAQVEASDADIAAEVATQFAMSAGPGEAYLGALSSLLRGTAEGVAHAGVVTGAKPAGFPGTLGLTTWNYGTWTYPGLTFASTERAKAGGAAGAKEWVAKINPTTVADAVHNAIASPAGKHKYSTQTINVKGTATTYDVQLEITPAYNTKISDAEQEHLNDLLLAYNLSIKAAGDAVNSLGANEYVAATQADAETAAKGAVAGMLNAALTADPAVWRAQLIALCGMTISGRDGKGWHTFGLVTTGPTVVVDNAAKTITHGLSDGTTSINTAASAAVIHF